MATLILVVNRTLVRFLGLTIKSKTLSTVESKEGYCAVKKGKAGVRRKKFETKADPSHMAQNSADDSLKSRRELNQSSLQRPISSELWQKRPSRNILGPDSAASCANTKRGVL